MELSQVLFLVLAYETAVLREAETAELPPSVLLCGVRVPLAVPLLMWCTPRLQSVTCSKPFDSRPAQFKAIVILDWMPGFVV